MIKTEVSTTIQKCICGLQVATTLEKQTRAKEKELVEFQKKYKIRMKVWMAKTSKANSEVIDALKMRYAQTLDSVVRQSAGRRR